MLMVYILYSTVVYIVPPSQSSLDSSYRADLAADLQSSIRYMSRNSERTRTGQAGSVTISASQILGNSFHACP